MRAVVLSETEGPERLELADVPERAADAHALIESRRNRGKVVLLP